MKKFLKVLLFIIIIFSIAFLAYVAYDYYFGSDSDDIKEIKIIKTIEDYDYSLKENATKIYKDEFDNLNDILSKSDISYEEYAKCIAKLFIIDFYTLSNKHSKNDIGGVEFVHPDIKDNFVEQARSTMYKYVKAGDKDYNDDLPEVSKINDIELIETTFTFKESKETTDAYKVYINWDYKEDFGYEKEANIIIVKVDKKLYIVEMD